MSSWFKSYKKSFCSYLKIQCCNHVTNLYVSRQLGCRDMYKYLTWLGHQNHNHSNGYCYSVSIMNSYNLCEMVPCLWSMWIYPPVCAPTIFAAISLSVSYAWAVIGLDFHINHIFIIVCPKHLMTSVLIHNSVCRFTRGFDIFYQ